MRISFTPFTPSSNHFALEKPGHSKSTHFSGATRYAERRLLSPEVFESVLRQFPVSYVGSIPAPLRASHLPPREIGKALDGLAEIFRALHVSRMPPITVQLGDVSITFELVGSGRLGQGYKTTINGYTYALKMFYDVPGQEPLDFEPEDIFVRRGNQVDDGNGPIPETASGILLTHHRVKDYAKFQFGNPLAAWGLDEWVNPTDDPSQAKGIYARELAQRLGFRYREASANNRNPHGKVWDRGWISARSPVPVDSTNSITPRTLSEFKQLLQSPDPLPSGLSDILLDLPRDEQREAFTEAVKDERFREQLARIIWISVPTPVFLGMLDSLQYAEVRHALDTSSFSLSFHSLKPKERWQAWQQLINQDEMKPLAAKMIGHLPQRHTQTALNMLGEDLKLQAHAANMLGQYPERDRLVKVKAWLEAADRESRTNIVRQFDVLPQADITTAFQLAEQYPECRSSLLNQLHLLPVETQNQKMTAWLENPEWRPVLARAIKTVPADFRMNAFERLWQDDNAREILLENLSSMSRAFLNRAYQLSEDDTEIRERLESDTLIWPDAVFRERFESLFNNPETRLQAVEDMHRLTPNNRLSWYLKAIEDPECRETAVGLLRHRNFLSLPQRLNAVKATLQYPNMQALCLRVLMQATPPDELVNIPLFWQTFSNLLASYSPTLRLVVPTVS